MIDETDVRFVTSAISSIRKGQLFSGERSFTILLFCFKIFSQNFIFDINKKECWSGLNTITSCFFYIQQPVKYFPTVSSFWSLIFVNGRLCIFMNLISVAYGRIQYSLTMVQMAQCSQFFIHWQKKRRKARLLKKLVANPFRFFPFNSIKPISGEHLFHLQGNMCFIVFSTLSALLTLVLGP